MLLSAGFYATGQYQYLLKISQNVTVQNVYWAKIIKNTITFLQTTQITTDDITISIPSPQRCHFSLKLFPDLLWQNNLFGSI